MVAYLRKGESLMKSDPAQADFLLRQAAAWSTDPRIVEGLKAPDFGATNYNDSYYNDIAESIQENLMILRYRGIAGRQPDLNILKDHCQAIAAWPPAWIEEFNNSNLSSACWSASRELFGEKGPGDLPITDRVIGPLNKHERETPRTLSESNKSEAK